ncbi:MAG: hypothetical protein KF850_18015 [Labilithrix sp.]|nr:hypothetical protein [Labilithrix sp.]
MKVPSHILQLLVVTVPIVAGCGGGDAEPAPATTDQNILAEPASDRVEALDRGSDTPGGAIAPSGGGEPSLDAAGETPPDEAVLEPPRGDAAAEPGQLPGLGGVQPGPASMPEPCPACGLG